LGMASSPIEKVCVIGNSHKPLWPSDKQSS
jgi:hypothetical protein